MLELLKFVLDKLDFIKLAGAIRRQRNRKAAAQLYSVLIQAYEILEIYRVLLDQLSEVLKDREVSNKQHRYYLNTSRVGSLLTRQASNLGVLDLLIRDLRDELRIVDDEFAEMWAQLLPGKFGILFRAEGLLMSGRLPISEGGPEEFPASKSGSYRTLWLTPTSPNEGRDEVEKYLHGWNGREKDVVDVNVSDGERFYAELSRYIREEKPYQRLAELEEVTTRYRSVLLEQFTLEDVLSEIGNVRKHW